MHTVAQGRRGALTRTLAHAIRRVRGLCLATRFFGGPARQNGSNIAHIGGLETYGELDLD